MTLFFIHAFPDIEYIVFCFVYFFLNIFLFSFFYRFYIYIYIYTTGQNDLKLLLYKNN